MNKHSVGAPKSSSFKHLQFEHNTTEPRELKTQYQAIKCCDSITSHDVLNQITTETIKIWGARSPASTRLDERSKQSGKRYSQCISIVLRSDIISTIYWKHTYFRRFPKTSITLRSIVSHYSRPLCLSLSMFDVGLFEWARLAGTHKRNSRLNRWKSTK